MTDRTFLGRWARRRAEQAPEQVPQQAREQDPEQAPQQAPQHAAAPAAAPLPAPDAQQAVREAPAAAPLPAPDAQQAVREAPAAPGAEEGAALPPVESLVAGSDLKPFLRPGVPAALRNAALRRMWLVTPAIRDHKDVALDYAWDWNAPGGVPGGGGTLDPEKVAQWARRIMGADPSPAAAPPAAPPAVPPAAPPAVSARPPTAGGPAATEPPAAPPPAPERDHPARDAPAPPARPRHGSARPASPPVPPDEGSDRRR